MHPKEGHEHHIENVRVLGADVNQQVLTVFGIECEQHVRMDPVRPVRPGPNRKEYSRSLFHADYLVGVIDDVVGWLRRNCERSSPHSETLFEVECAGGLTCDAVHRRIRADGLSLSHSPLFLQFHSCTLRHIQTVRATRTKKIQKGAAHTPPMIRNSMVTLSSTITDRTFHHGSIANTLPACSGGWSYRDSIRCTHHYLQRLRGCPHKSKNKKQQQHLAWAIVAAPAHAHALCVCMPSARGADSPTGRMSVRH